MDPSREGRQSTDSGYRADGRGTAGGTLVGLTTADGVLVAADTRTSQGTVVRSETAQKLSQIHPTAVLGSTGSLGAVQSFVRAIRSETERYELERGEPMDMAALSTVVATELRERALSGPRFLLGGVDADGPHLFALGSAGSAFEESYAALGSGQQSADGVLDDAEPLSPSMSEARRAAARALRSAAERDVQTGVNIHLAEISDDGVTLHHTESVEDLLNEE
jgi:proteasome beta subunit